MESGGDGDMEHVSGHELWRSHGGTCEISQQRTEGLSYLLSWGCAPSAEGWGRDSLSLSLGLSVPLGWDSYLPLMGSQRFLP